MTQVPQSGESHLLSERGVTVTKTRFVIPGKTYAINGVSVVEWDKRRPNFELLSLCIGALIACFVVAVACVLMGNWFPVPFCLILAVVMAGLLWYFRHEFRSSFVVMLTTASGRAECFRTFDRQFAIRIVEALNQSIVSRG